MCNTLLNVCNQTSGLLALYGLLSFRLPGLHLKFKLIRALPCFCLLKTCIQANIFYDTSVKPEWIPGWKTPTSDLFFLQPLTGLIGSSIASFLHCVFSCGFSPLCDLCFLKHSGLIRSSIATFLHCVFSFGFSPLYNLFFLQPLRSN